jgi:hypothetical protein
MVRADLSRSFHFAGMVAVCPPPTRHWRDANPARMPPYEVPPVAATFPSEGGASVSAYGDSCWPTLVSVSLRTGIGRSAHGVLPGISLSWAEFSHCDRMSRSPNLHISFCLLVCCPVSRTLSNNRSVSRSEKCATTSKEVENSQKRRNYFLLRAASAALNSFK